MTELDDVRRRLGALENRVGALEDGHGETRRVADLFAMVDRDVADLRTAFSDQTRVLQALRDTQLEQGRVLVEHGQAIGAVVVTLEAIQESMLAMRADQQAMRADQQAMRAELTTQGETLKTQGETLATQGVTLAGHGEILARLDPGH